MEYMKTELDEIAELRAVIGCKHCISQGKTPTQLQRKLGLMVLNRF